MKNLLAIMIGILSLQGAFREHQIVLENMGCECMLVNSSDQLSLIDGLIIPGGESTTIGLIAKQNGLLEPLREYVRNGRPVWVILSYQGNVLWNDYAEQQDIWIQARWPGSDWRA